MKLNKLVSKVVVVAMLSAGAVTSANSTINPVTRYMKVYEQHAFKSCKNAITCVVPFSVLIDHVDVTSVSCNFFYNSQSIFPTGVALGNIDGNDNFNVGEFFGGLQQLYVADGVSQWQFNNQTNHVVPKTYKPGVLVNLSNQVGTLQVDCMIHGKEFNP